MVPYHVANLPKPQKLYGIVPDNSNTTFRRGNLPVEFNKFDSDDFVDPPSLVESLMPVMPNSLELTPFTYIDTEEGLKMLRSKLSEVDEFAVDLEANMYRSFQGLTCLMQISTRTEDFVVDTLKLFKCIGPYLGSLFLDPKKKKVMQGAGNDILWLQRDFGIYVCNLFDTMQASRILKLERNGLEFLLKYFCGVSANKQYQTSDWRIRPLPKEMVHYAREDTHYLFYIYDSMRKLLVAPTPEYDNPLLEVYKRTQKICTTLYEKELFTDDSYKSLYGLSEAGFNTQQLQVVERLYRWRDFIAREYDESTGYVMPNKLLLLLSQKMPSTNSQIEELIAEHYSSHPFLLKGAAQILKIINEPSIEAAVEMRRRAEMSMRQGGYYGTAHYPPRYYVGVPCQPRFYAQARYPVMAKSIYCTYPNYNNNQYILC